MLTFLTAFNAHSSLTGSQRYEMTFQQIKSHYAAAEGEMCKKVLEASSIWVVGVFKWFTTVTLNNNNNNNNKIHKATNSLNDLFVLI